MGRTITLLLGLIWLIPSGFAAEPDYRFVWVRTFLGPCCTDMGLDLVVDDSAAVFVAGVRGGIDLDRDGDLELPAYGTPDSFVFSSREDDTPGWARGPGGPRDDAALGIAVDGAGGAYVVGYFQASLQVDDTTVWRARGRSDGYLIRYDREGGVRWAKPIGGDGDDRLDDVWTDAAGNVYVAGTTSGRLDVDRDGTVDTETGASGALLAAFAADGTLRWARTTAGRAREMGRALTVGPAGDAYLGGIYLAGELDIDGDGNAEGPAPPDRAISAFLARYDADGALLWSRVYSGASMLVTGPMAIAGNGDLLVLGAHNGPADLDGDGSVDVDYRPLGDDRRLRHDPDVNSFLARFRPDGELAWVRRFAARVGHVSTHGKRIVMSGSYTGPFDLDDDGVLERADDGDDWAEGFAAILDEKGALRHVFTLAGLDGDEIKAAGFTPDGQRLYATGYVRLSADFDGDDVPEGAAACHQLGDAFLARYDVPDSTD